jgi:hypothetical protein
MRIPLILGVITASMAVLPATSIAQSAGSADQLNAQSAPAPATTTDVLSADPAQPDAVVTNFPGNANAVPAEAADKTYPVCSARLQDNCQNRGEGGAPGRSHALKHWPGKPASEM